MSRTAGGRRAIYTHGQQRVGRRPASAHAPRPNLALPFIKSPRSTARTVPPFLPSPLPLSAQLPSSLPPSTWFPVPSSRPSQHVHHRRSFSPRCRRLFRRARSNNHLCCSPCGPDVCLLGPGTSVTPTQSFQVFTHSARIAVPSRAYWRHSWQPGRLQPLQLLYGEPGLHVPDSHRQHH